MVTKIQQVVFSILFLFVGISANSQDIDFNVRYNGATDAYEVYARPTFTNPLYFVGGGSQISVLLPASTSDLPLIINPVNGGLWTDNSQVYAPGADPLHDYHGIATNGAVIPFVNGVEVLLFTFSSIIPEPCSDVVRLFENGTDPGPGAVGMNGGDFQMFFANAFDPFNNNWRMNYSNPGQLCPEGPVVISNPITTPQSVTANICVPILDLNENDSFTATRCFGSPSNGTATTTVSGNTLCVEYTPTGNFTGQDDICIVVCDLAGLCDTVSVPVTVTPILDPIILQEPPIVIVTPITTVQDSSVSICTAILDHNTGDTFTTSFCGGAQQNGTASASIVDNVLCLEYLPNTGYTGEDDICIEVCDQAGNCDAVNIPVSIVPTPLASDTAQNPILVMPPAVISEDVALTVCGPIIDANISDVHTVVICAPPTNATATAVVNNADNSLCITIDPDQNFIGSDSVCVTICDQGALCFNLVVPIEVIALNSPPLAINDINNTQVNVPTSGNVLRNDTDTDGNDLSVNTTPVSINGGTVTIDASGNYTFVPDLDFSGDASFEYEVCDNGVPGGCDTRTVSIAVIDITDPENNEVIGIPDNFQMENDLPLFASLLSNDSDPDGDFITINTTPVTAPSNGVLTINFDGTFSYVPAPGFIGVETFSYEVCDNGSPQDCDIVPVTITVLDGDGGNDVYATDDSHIGEEDGIFLGNVLLNDNNPEIGLMTVSIFPLVAPEHGTLVLSPDGTYIYTPDPGFTGNDQFVYRVCDIGLPSACDSATMYISVLNVSTDLKLKVMLQGALFESPDNLMRADLVAADLVPLDQPYNVLDQPLYASRFLHVHGGNEKTTPEVLNANAGTPDAIVDWVFVELRSAFDSLIVLRTLSALVQRDGDVVDAATGGLIYVDSLPDQFFAIVKHRSHLGVMTAAPVVTNRKVASFDFTTASNIELYNISPGYNGLEQVTISGHKALWAGNCNADDRVKYDGVGNDRLIINSNVILDPSNTSGTLNYDNAIGYYLGDVNMDGKVKYDAISNDRILLQSNILNYPLNTALLNNFNLLIEQVK